jgi:hypothetical protein
MLGAKPDKLTGFGIAIAKLSFLPASRAAFERDWLWLWQLVQQFVHGRIRGRTDASATLLPFGIKPVPLAPLFGSYERVDAGTAIRSCCSDV